VFNQVEKPSDILAADKLLFPGVGAYEQAMGALRERGYIDALKEYVQVISCFSFTYIFMFLMSICWLHQA
jgi:imidazoleglycerol phosphate synthase glutamine amidotransferase subunit HisH